MSDYRKELVSGFWNYQKQAFPDWEKYLERPFRDDGRPPVFKRELADNNVIMSKDMSDIERKQLLGLVPDYKRHKWFRSMSSSQALAQSVFGNLKLKNKLHYLCEITDNDGKAIFDDDKLINDGFHLEYTIDYLSEPRPTSIDAFLDGEYRVSIECKLTESEFGSCSRPLLTSKDSNYDMDFCDGSYTFQRGRKDRCPLTSRRISYWKHIPDILKWANDIDYTSCPLYKTYQLVRNIIAACVKPNGKPQSDSNYAVLIYDERNPAFQNGGNGMIVFTEVRKALHKPSMLRKCSWQNIVSLLQTKPEFSWLADELCRKYGFCNMD